MQHITWYDFFVLQVFNSSVCNRVDSYKLCKNAVILLKKLCRQTIHQSSCR